MPVASISAISRFALSIVFAIAPIAPATAVTQGANAPATAEMNLSRAQFLATMDADYRSMDLNGDGAATRAEVEAYQRKVLTVAAAERARADFAKLDADRNGQVSLAEYTRGNVGLPKSLDVSGPMSKLDSNKDGKITLIEYRILTLANFDRLDADKDSIITKAERSAVGTR